MLSFPQATRLFRRTSLPYPLNISLAAEPLPATLAPSSVLVRVRAVSLNYRDVAMLHEGAYPGPASANEVPASDCSAEVLAVGSAVTRFQVGDRVSPTCDVGNLTGKERDAATLGLGGNVPGVLREYAIFEEEVLVRLPEYLSWEEAAILSCAGLTAWTSLDSPSTVEEGTSALMQGTGGVSMFALLICIAAGIKPIITSSSDTKLREIKKLSPEIGGINYKKHSDVTAEVLRLTHGKGVDFVVNNTGPASIPTDLAVLRQKRGTISLVGFLEGMKADWDPSLLLNVMAKTATIQGIQAGSRQDYEKLNEFLEEKKVRLHSIIDRTFSFEDSPAAFSYLWSGKHVGKVVIKL